MSNPFEEAFNTWWADHGSKKKRTIYEVPVEFHKRIAAQAWHLSDGYTITSMWRANKLTRDEISAAFNKWWDEEGSAIRPSKFQDIEEFTKHMTSKAWIKAAEHAVNEIDKGN